MLGARVIPCLDVTAGRVVKGVNFVGLRDAGDPVELAARYDAEGADELVLLDITASSDDRQTMVDVVYRTAEQVFIPLTVGGGVRTVDDVDRLLRAGADKVGVNTAAIARPELIGTFNVPGAPVYSLSFTSSGQTFGGLVSEGGGRGPVSWRFPGTTGETGGVVGSFSLDDATRSFSLTVGRLSPFGPQLDGTAKAGASRHAPRRRPRPRDPLASPQADGAATIPGAIILTGRRRCPNGRCRQRRKSSAGSVSAGTGGAGGPTTRRAC